MEKQLLLINDKHNSYNKVKAAIIMILKRHPFNAEQLTYLAHHKGSIQIKVGEFMEVLECQNQFEELGIETKIEDYEPTIQGALY